MVAHVAFGEVASILIAGATFIPLAIALRFGLSQFGLTTRDSKGSLRKGPSAIIALCYGALVFAHMMAIWFVAPNAFHPVLAIFYGTSSGLMGLTTRAKSTVAMLRSRS